jgi:hypothetical protein
MKAMKGKVGFKILYDITEKEIFRMADFYQVRKENFLFFLFSRIKGTVAPD